MQTRFDHPQQTTRLLIITVIEIPTKESAPKTTVRLLHVGLHHIPCLEGRESRIISVDAIVVVPDGDKGQLLVYRTFVRVGTQLPKTKDDPEQHEVDGLSQMVLSERNEHRGTIALLCIPAQA
jgi:hypothetical protein